MQVRYLLTVIVVLAVSCGRNIAPSHPDDLKAMGAAEYSDFATWCEQAIMEQPVILSEFSPRYLKAEQDYAMTIGIAITPGGRIWNCVVGGGDNSKAYFVLNWSDDGGATWTDNKFVVDPHDDSFPLRRRTLVGNLWTDPRGRLWLFFDQGLSYFDGRLSNWCSVCENPDAEQPEWSKPRYIGFGCSLQRPTVMSTGEWVLPVSLWTRKYIDSNAESKNWQWGAFHDAYHELDAVRGPHAFVSKDEGKTWKDTGFISGVPSPRFDEHIFIELADGRWWATIRTGSGETVTDGMVEWGDQGIWQSFSEDKGVHWSEPTFYQSHVSSRHIIMPLTSGRLLLVRHDEIGTETLSRRRLTAYVSANTLEGWDGKSWIGGLLLDSRSSISYPCAVQDEWGHIYISYDYARASVGEIYMARVTEADIVARKVSSSGGFMSKLIYKAGKLK